MLQVSLVPREFLEFPLMNIEVDELPGPKRAREFNDLYDASPKRKPQPRVAVEGLVRDETDGMDLN